MDVTKRIYKNINSLIIFIYLALFPLGQLLRIHIHLFAKDMVVQAIDIVALTSLIIAVRIKNQPLITKYFLRFLIVALFSLLFSVNFFPVKDVFTGSFYLIRLLSYFSFFVVVWNENVSKKITKNILSGSLIIISLFVAGYGWIQYFFVPNFTPLKILGWDDHLYRLAGTFLDPGYTAIIIIFGLLISLSILLATGNKKYISVVIFLLLSVAFTYSRASYLALFTGLFVLFYLAKKLKLIIIVFILTIFILPFLPRPGGEGIRLERTVSTVARFQNYKETLSIFGTSPVFGIGFNNMCYVRVKIFTGDGSSHACSGSDSSILLVLSTTGIIGFFVFGQLVLKILSNITQDTYGYAFISCFLALIIDSFFVNSLFYSWVMGYMGILLAIALKE